MYRPLNILMRLGRAKAIVAMVFAGVVAILSGSSAEAGVMLPWAGLTSASESSSAVVDFGSEGCSSRTEHDRSSSREPAPSEREEKSNRTSLVAGLLGTGGGASAPVNSASGQTSLLLAAVFQVPAVLPLLTCLSRRLRERSLQLPQPPLGELLDPPKAIA